MGFTNLPNSNIFPVSYYLFENSNSAQRLMHLIVFTQSTVLYLFHLKNTL